MNFMQTHMIQRISTPQLLLICVVTQMKKRLEERELNLSLTKEIIVTGL